MLQRRIGKGPFHNRLTIVELAIDRDGADVFGQRRHQLSLADTDLVEREQHDDLNAGNVVKRVRDRRAGIAARGGQNRDVLSSLPENMPEHSRHHLRREILERRGWHL